MEEMIHANTSVRDDNGLPIHSTTLGIFKIFMMLLAEQNCRWVYFLAFFAACTAAGTPLMAWLFAHVFNVFTSADIETIRPSVRFWSLM